MAPSSRTIKSSIQHTLLVCQSSNAFGFPTRNMSREQQKTAKNPSRHFVLCMIPVDSHMTCAPWILPELPGFMDPLAVQETWMREATLRTIGTVALHVMAAKGPCAAIFRWWKLWLLEVDIISEAFKLQTIKSPPRLRVYPVPIITPKNATTSRSCMVYLQHPTARNSSTNRIMFFKNVARTMSKSKLQTGHTIRFHTCLFYHLAQMFKNTQLLIGCCPFQWTTKT